MQQIQLKSYFNIN